MDTWHAIDTVRVVRDFAERPLDPAQLERILNAGRRAGSSKNAQRWTFIEVRDRARLQQLAAVGPYAAHVAGAAAAIALVTPDPRAPGAPLSIVWDLGRAAQNMVLGAWAMGIGSCPVTVYDHDLARRLLGYPADRHCEYLLSLGYPADPGLLAAPSRAGGRLPLDRVVRRETW